jgi:hypothetical protein
MMPEVRGGDASSRLLGSGAAPVTRSLAVDKGSEFGAVTGAEFGAGTVEVALDGAD